MNTLLWLDDCRNPMTDDWLNFSLIGRNVEVIWVKSYMEFVDYIMAYGLPTAICFDYDLGEDVVTKRVKDGMSESYARILKKRTLGGIDCARWLIKYCIIKKQLIPLYNIQSLNPIGKENIDMLLKNYIKHNELI